MDIKIITVEPITRNAEVSLVFDTEFPARQGWYAKVEEGDETLHLSRWDGEDRWIVDGRFRRSLPIFHNGVGSRATLLEPASVEVEAALGFAIAAAERPGAQSIVKETP